MSKSAWIIIGVGAALVLGVAIVLFLVGQNSRPALPSSGELPVGVNDGSREAGIFRTIWDGVGAITGGVVSAATSNTEPSA